MGETICNTKIDLGPEMFLAPEIFFDPSIYNQQYNQSIAQIVFDAIQDCPIDCRKVMYSNVYLSGGSTIMKGFAERL